MSFLKVLRSSCSLLSEVVVESLALTESLIYSIAGVGWYFLVAVKGLTLYHDKFPKMPFC